MPWRITATLCSISGAAMLCVLAGACTKPEEARSTAVLVYCTPDVVHHAQTLARLTARCKVTLAPMTVQDIVAALEGARVGDFALFAGDGFAAELRSRRLLRLPATAVHTLGVCLVSAEPLALSDVARPGLRLGLGPSGGALDQALPAALRETFAQRVVHRSGRAEELVRLVRLGALDAAFVWDTPPPAPDLPTLTLPREEVSCPLHVVILKTSRVPVVEAKTLVEFWRTAFAAAGSPGK